MSKPPPKTGVYTVVRETDLDISQFDAEQTERAIHLAEWWMTNAVQEMLTLVPKAIEYGSADLRVMGDAMLVLMPQLQGVVDGQELAIAFYQLGKVARLFGGYAQGHSPSDDTWYDQRIYAAMAAHVREFGKW